MEHTAVNELWGWDLKADLDVFSDLHIFTPLDLYDLNKFPYTFPKGYIHFHPLPFFRSPIQFLTKLLKVCCIFYRCIQKDDIMH